MKRFKVTVNGTPYDVVVEENAATTAPVAAAPAPAAVPVAPAAEAPAAPAPAPSAVTPAAAGAEMIEAPMPGTVLDVKVKVGDSFKAGDVLLILEAMKMENEIMAPKDGVVAGIHVAKNDSVNSGDSLISLN